MIPLSLRWWVELLEESKKETVLISAVDRKFRAIRALLQTNPERLFDCRNQKIESKEIIVARDACGWV